MQTNTSKVEHMSFEEFMKTHYFPVVLPRSAVKEVNGVRPFSRREMWHLLQGEVVYTKIAGWCILNADVHVQSE